MTAVCYTVLQDARCTAAASRAGYVRTVRAAQTISCMLAHSPARRPYVLQYMASSRRRRPAGPGDRQTAAGGGLGPAIERLLSGGHRHQSTHRRPSSLTRDAVGFFFTVAQVCLTRLASTESAGRRGDRRRCRARAAGTARARWMATGRGLAGDRW